MQSDRKNVYKQICFTSSIEHLAQNKCTLQITNWFICLFYLIAYSLKICTHILITICSVYCTI